VNAVRFQGYRILLLTHLQQIAGNHEVQSCRDRHYQHSPAWLQYLSPLPYFFNGFRNDKDSGYKYQYRLYGPGNVFHFAMAIRMFLVWWLGRFSHCPQGNERCQQIIG
jgi:hypothetical protein